MNAWSARRVGLGLLVLATLCAPSVASAQGDAAVCASTPTS